MDNDQIINYVMNTPGNTNAEVLRGMLNQLNNGGGGDGLTLYGPYMATVHAAISVKANAASSISLSDLYNGSMQLVDMSQMTQDTKFFFIGFSCTDNNLSVLGASIPNEMNPFPTIRCANNTASPISISVGAVYVLLYSNTDFPAA